MEFAQKVSSGFVRVADDRK